MLSSLFKVLPNSVTQNLTAAYFTVQTWRTRGRRGIYTEPQVFKYRDMDIKILPALQDNYMYLIIDNKTRDAAIVDPVDPDSVILAVEEAKVNLKKILTTHHHWDHAGGNEKLVAKFKTELEVIGGDDRIGGLTNKVKHDDTFMIGELSVRCLFTPCHTTGHICYYVTSSEGDQGVFTGDTLFSGGCGRFFEGTADQMYSALIDKLSALPDETNVFCGHEYTLQNLNFAQHIEPDNEDIQKRIEWAKEKRSKFAPTVPSSIGEEKKINPFMRVNLESVQKHAKQNDGISTMHSIRKEKDSFKS